MKQFYAPARYKWKLPQSLDAVAGGIIQPSGIAEPFMRRRDPDIEPYLKRSRLIDPQLYLASLNPQKCAKACKNLASYDWFPGEAPRKYKSSQQKQAEWAKKASFAVAKTWINKLPTEIEKIEDLIRICIQTQMEFGCSALILPSPIISNPRENYGEQVTWLEAGLRLAKETYPDTHCIASLPISDVCLDGIDPNDNRLIDTIVDQVSARMPNGAYVVVAQQSATDYYCNSENTIGALLRLVRGLKAGGVGKVIISAGVAGFLALAAGADAWSTGWYRSERRLRLEDFDDEGEGPVYPTFYSHALIGDISAETDLDLFVTSGLLEDFRDKTTASEGLMKAFEEGKRVCNVPEWEYRMSNVSAARRHFLNACVRETNAVATLDPATHVERTQNWLERAVDLASRARKIEPEDGFDRRTSISHQTAWRDAFEKFVSTD